MAKIIQLLKNIKSNLKGIKYTGYEIFLFNLKFQFFEYFNFLSLQIKFFIQFQIPQIFVSIFHNFKWLPPMVWGTPIVSKHLSLWNASAALCDAATTWRAMSARWHVIMMTHSDWRHLLHLLVWSEVCV
jgi:hypothetical protein